MNRHERHTDYDEESFDNWGGEIEVDDDAAGKKAKQAADRRRAKA